MWELCGPQAECPRGKASSWATLGTLENLPSRQRVTHQPLGVLAAGQRAGCS